MENKRFLNANDVSEYFGVSKQVAYKIIRRMNMDLAAKGYITLAGKVSRVYFEQRVYGDCCALQANSNLNERVGL